MTRLAVVFLCLFAAVPAFSQVETLDPAFGENGFTTVGVGQMAFQGAAAATRLPDGRLIVAGSLDGLSSVERAFVLRFLPNGVLDSSFGDGGVQLVDGDLASFSYIEDVVVQPDGRIVVLVGRYSESFLVRYLPDGGEDVTFGTDGIAQLPLGADALTLDSDGRLVVAGYVPTENGANPAVARFMSDGTLDSSFGDAGLAALDAGASARAATLGITSEGDIVIGGSIGVGEDTDFLVAQLRTDGTPDPDFGNGGIAVTAVSDDLDRIIALAVAGGDAVVVTGVTGDPASASTDTDFALARYLPDGSLDASFGTMGVVTTSVGSRREYGRAIAVEDKHVLVAGFSLIEPNLGGHFTLLRYNQNGMLDGSFGDGGVVSTPGNETVFGGARDLVLTDMGETVAVGILGSSVAVARYEADGALDETFSNDGIALTNRIAPGFDIVRDAALQTDGSVLVVGAYEYAPYSRCLLARFESDGTLNPAFGDGGIVDPETHGDACALEWDAVAVRDDGFVAVTGMSDGFSFAGFTPSGQLDPSFGIAGLAFVPTAGGAVANDLLVTSGAVVAVGNVGDAGNPARVAAVRLTADGQPDGTFGTDGLALFEDLIDSRFAASSAVATSDDELVIGIDDALGADDATYTLARVRSDGTRDPDYGDNGMVYGSLGASSALDGIALRDDGRIVVAGRSAPPRALALAQHLPDGSLDPAFGTAGRVETAISAGFPIALSLQDDLILTASRAAFGSGPPRLFSARFEADGSSDTSFGVNGRAVAPLEDSEPVRVFAQSEGRVVVVGTASNPDGESGHRVALFDQDILLVGFSSGLAPNEQADGSDLARQALSLGTVYPNPSAEAAHVVMESARTEHVVAILTDVLGRRVATLFDGPLAGRTPFTLSLPVAGLEAGTYFLRVRGSAVQTTRAFTVVR